MPELDTDLLLRALAGDAGALRLLLSEHGPKARAAIQGKIDKRWRSVLDEDDVMQVAYLEAFLHLDSLEARDIPGFVAWLARIAQNALRDAIRGLSRDKRPHPARRVTAAGGADSYIALLDALGATSTTPSRLASANEAAKNLDSALEKLPADYRAVVQLYDLQGHPATEVAARLNRSVGAVHMLRARAHDRLRHLLGTATQFFTGSA